MVREQRLAVAALGAAGLIWGLTWWPLKYFGGLGLSGLAVTLLTHGVAGAVALPLIWRQRHMWWPQRHRLLLSGLQGGIVNCTFITALMSGEVVRVMLLFYLAPVWGALGGRLFLSETLTRARLLAVPIAVAGAFCVLGGPGALSAPLSAADGLALAAGIFYAGQNIAARAADRVPTLTKALSVFVGGGLLAAGAWALGAILLPSPSPPLTLQLAALMLWILGAMWTTMYGVTHLEAGRAAVLLVFELVVAVVSAMLIAGERLTWLGWIGAGLITSAALIETRSPPRADADIRSA